MNIIKKILLTMCLIVVVIGCCSTTSEAAKDMTLNTTVQSTNKIKLTWKKQKGVEGYKIYKYTYYVDGNYKEEVIATLGKNKCSFTDKNVKTNQEYFYGIYAYYYKNGKQKNKFVGWADRRVSTKLEKPRFDEDEDWDEGIYGLVKTSANQIKIPIGTTKSVIGVDVLGNTSIKPDGIEVFKKVGKKYVSYKKIKIKNNKKKIYYFTDKKVKKGKKYTYKFRTYKKINGKTIYSEKTNAFTVCAMNNYTALDVAVTEAFDMQERTMVMSVTNNTDYGAFSGFHTINYMLDNTATVYDIDFDIISYSYDQVTWNTDVSTCKVQPGKTIYLRLKEDTKHSQEYESKTAEKKENISFCFQHKFYQYWIEYDIMNNKQDICHE